MHTLESFKKANRERRQRMAEKAGFKTVEKYLKYLLSIDTTFDKAVKSTEKANNMVIAFDTTGSMRSYIAAVRQHVMTLIPTLFRNTPNLKLKIVAFGDYCDMTNSSTFGKAYQESKFTDDENHLIQFVTTARDTSGGDGDEFYELVIQKIVNETPWEPNSTRTVLLIGDADPHKVGYSYSSKVYNAQIDWKAEARKARDLGIKFDTLMINDYTPWFRELSQITDGTSLPFKSSGKTSEVVEASVYFNAAKGGSVTATAAFNTKMRSAILSEDEELIGMYKSFNAKL